MLPPLPFYIIRLYRHRRGDTPVGDLVVPSADPERVISSTPARLRVYLADPSREAEERPRWAELLDPNGSILAAFEATQGGEVERAPEGH